jgi:hypothetical protein
MIAARIHASYGVRGQDDRPSNAGFLGGAQQVLRTAYVHIEKLPNESRWMDYSSAVNQGCPRSAAAEDPDRLKVAQITSNDLQSVRGAEPRGVQVWQDEAADTVL